ncbi:hypothetical protein [Abyssalbus ytuae]|uniref:PNPLA domain-containing protein n=1 Tax=Abyssalbus ytuae TaxID=2926907 RepID=A0A9E6ZT71_9FLAO|nr:hypothetical protein [Abyssalbus ytuae]UOB18408.1 hypothetical protein MQE35_03750 [Abyssalbus ytuae]
MNPTFHLGITMAGAVSAGAYTAGFMDYILEALEEWEKAKEINRKYKPGDKEYNNKIPMHDVVIDALGGASAGGMVSMITALSFYYKKIKPVTNVSYSKTGNILYDSWVFLDDDLKGDGTGKTTFEKMLSTDDIKSKKAASSLLNSKPIDAIAEQVFYNLPADAHKNNFPRYISRDLRVILTLTSLKPVDYIVNFSRIKSAFMDTTPGHRISNHEIICHFKVNFDIKKDKDIYLPFQPKEKKSRDFLMNVTKATGAFPVGLEPRHFSGEFTKGYVEKSLSRREEFTKGMDVRFDIRANDFKFTAVDGGTINNEPFDEVIRSLVSKYGPPDPKKPRYGTIMVDPFPNFEYGLNSAEPDFQESITAVVGKIIPTILNQARNKRNDTFGIGFLKLMAFPIKWEKKGSLKPYPPLATSGLGGFGGFLDVNFRVHDFFLGRDNAKNFLRAFLFLEFDPENPSYLFKNVHPEAVKTFSRTIIDKSTNTSKTYLPIIPDISFINGDKNPYSYKVNDFPKLNKEKFQQLRSPIKKRVKAILKLEIKQRTKKGILRALIMLVSPGIVNKITKWVMEAIEKDFTKRQQM